MRGCGYARLLFPGYWLARENGLSMALASFGRRFQLSFLLGRPYSDRSSLTHKTAPRFQVDTNSALLGKTRREVFRGWMVYKLLSYNWIVKRSMELYSVSRRFLGQRLTESLLRATVAGQFLGGFSEEEAAGVAENLASKKICSLWAYSKELDLSGSRNGLEEANFDETNNLYLQSIQASGKHNYQASPVKFVAVKVTAIVNPNILLKLSQMLAVAQQHRVGTGNMTQLNAAGEQRRADVAKWMQSFKIHENLSRLQGVSQAQGCSVSFSEEESQQLHGLIRRLDELGECAVKKNVRILVSAEESRLQRAIHYLTVHHMMAKFNLMQPYIYNTIQMYLKSSLQALLMDIATAKSAGFKYGLKMVRGAYMQYEKLTAVSSGTEYPILPNKEATNNSYNEGLRLTIGEIAGGSVGGMIVASHNQESVELGVDIMEEFGIPRDSGAVCFGQQLGMGDHLSYPLAQNGYIVQKHLAYGDADNVFPFLVRRGQENNQASENAKLERELYAKEMKRRWLL